MPSTLLAVDDSVTMRKVLEITFTSPDFKVVSAPTGDAALQKLKSDKPDIVICDLTLEPKNGYDVCKALKAASPTTPVLLLSSKQNPYDAGKGAASQADDHMDKPFDTQQLIDKVKKMLAAPAGAVAAPAAAKPAGPATSPTAPAMTAAATVRPVPAPSPSAPGMPSPTMQRAKTLIYNPPVGAAPGSLPGVPAAVSRNAATVPLQPTPVTGLPVQAREPTPAPQPVAHASAAAAHVNGQMAGKLEALGLSAAQADAVMALSREVVERVVWEVVPVLAETLIKEELARLTK